MNIYEWTETADGNVVMGAIRVVGNTFTSDDFSPSQIRHLVGMSLAIPATEKPKLDVPKTPYKPSLKLGEMGTYDDAVERLTNIYLDSGWTAIKAIAANYGITQKPVGGWDEAIPLIAKLETNGGEG